MRKRITKDYGMYDYYKFYKEKYKTNVSRSKYNKVVGEIMEKIINAMLYEELDRLTLPKLNMHIVILKYKGRPYIKDGKLKNNIPVDWKSTKDLWEANPEAKEKKLTLRYTNYHTSKYVFRIMMRKYHATFKNKVYYNFKACRGFQRALAKRIKDSNEEQFDAFKWF